MDRPVERAIEDFMGGTPNAVLGRLFRRLIPDLPDIDTTPLDLEEKAIILLEPLSDMERQMLIGSISSLVGLSVTWLTYHPEVLMAVIKAPSEMIEAINPTLVSLGGQ